jgi:molybdate transport system permease protein
MEYFPFLLTLKLALVTTICLLIIGIPISYWLAFTKSKLRSLIEALVSMPLVLPPTVIGFYLLLVLGKNTMVGSWFNKVLGIELAFSFTGLVIGSIIYSLPFMVQPIQSGLRELPKNYTLICELHNKSFWFRISKVYLPNIKRSLLAAIVLTFAHTVGEFGVVLMLGGSIPGETKVASIAIYDHVEALEYSSAGTYSLVMFIFSFIVLWVVYLIRSNKTLIK